jgi:hypothetical protein
MPPLPGSLPSQGRHFYWPCQYTRRQFFDLRSCQNYKVFILSEHQSTSHCTFARILALAPVRRSFNEVRSNAPWKEGTSIGHIDIQRQSLLISAKILCFPVPSKLYRRKASLLNYARAFSKNQEHGSPCCFPCAGKDPAQFDNFLKDVLIEYTELQKCKTQHKIFLQRECELHL